VPVDGARHADADGLGAERVPARHLQDADRVDDDLGDLERGRRHHAGGHDVPREHGAPDTHGRRHHLGDVDVHGDHVRAGSVRVDDVRGAPDARAAAGHRFAQHAELDQLGHQHADGRAGQPEALGELGAGQCAVAMHLTQHRGQVVAPHRLGSCRG
jgi:hypothetical protein